VEGTSGRRVGAPLNPRAARAVYARERADGASERPHSADDLSMTSSLSTQLSDDHGSASLDWVRDGVLFARTEGSLSARLGAAFARALQSQIQAAPMLHYFGDASRLDQYDLLARSAFMRVVLQDRQKIRTFTLLTWAEGVSSVARAFAELIGPSATILTDRTDFDRRLLRAAPEARTVLDAASPLLRVPLQRASR
jgi:hypothetical protein